MASAQALKKQEQLEAGKRRLEEFRKKKAAERAKKSSTSQTHASDVSLHEKQPAETDPVRLTDSNGAGTSDEPGTIVMGSSAPVTDIDNKAIDFPIKNENFLSNDTFASSLYSMKDYNAYSTDSVQKHADNQEFQRYDVSGFAGSRDVSYRHEMEGPNNEFGIYTGVQGRLPYETNDQSIFLRPQASQDFDNTAATQSSFHRMDESQSTDNNSYLMQSRVTNHSYSHVSTAKISPQNSGGTLPQDSIPPATNLRGSAPEAWQHVNGIAHVNDSMISDYGERKLSSSTGSLPSVNNSAVQAWEGTGLSTDFRSSSNHVPLYSVTPETTRRSRPSFLDSLNVPRASSGTLFQRTEPQESFMSSSLITNSTDVLGSSPFQKPLVETETMGPYPMLKTSNGPSVEHSMNFSDYSSNEGDLLRPNINENRIDRKQEFYSAKQNEDFAALEQHIEDLTQEKFSLQRALEASRALAESLAAENSSMTDSYNQQRGVVNQLKSDMENLQEEIKAQLQVELESVKIEYANAQLECYAADERAKLLASEVIGLEEKALRLRSSELKLGRQLENTQAEISSYKKKMTSLEKDRQDLQSTIDALQEEKKLLQSKLRKASTSAKSIDISNSPLIKRDMSTSTEDLDASIHETHEAASSLESEASNISLLPDNGQSTLEFSSVNIPSDQMRMIQNINALISEVALEKEELMQALTSESSHCSKLKELNKELSRKLEAQTQRLELLTAQSMANENIPTRQPDSRIMHENTPYADEGDEVVERVLGWIMKLFPGGPSRRRTSKLL
ncbi:protein BLISTER isoform X4 [Quercus lobata]|uniref:protein BLISTER isoform X4 n=1 Tax=Quercus lobata TaxID=97700 RepID=UPI001244D03F|nr:protein BLISTER isoform X4 [Quercus lobata]